MSESVLPLFSSKSFIVFGFTFSLNFNFVHGVRECSHFIHLHVAVQFSRHHLLKRLSLHHYKFLPPLTWIQFSHSVVPDSLWPHGLQHARLPCPSPTPGVHSNSCPLSRWCHPAISSSVVPFSSCLQSFPASGSFSSESVLLIRWPKYWSFSFSISPSNEYSGLISFRMDWFALLAVQGTLTSLLQHHGWFKGINSSALSFLYSPTLTSIHDYWKNHSFD